MDLPTDANLPAAAWWFVLLLVIAVPAAFFWWGSWHARKYTAKHERVEQTAEQFVDRLGLEGGNVRRRFEDKMAAIQDEADRKAQELEAAFRARFGGDK